MKTTLFISDLHLSAATPTLNRIFIDFLESLDVQQHDALYILGDLFDAWLGDDDTEIYALEIQNALKGLSEQGLPVLLQRGNRDFLLGNHFEKQTGCTLLKDKTVIDLYGNPTLLMHGDLLCTDDTDYQRMRRILHSYLGKVVLYTMSLGLRQKLANLLRKQSQLSTQEKNAALMDVNAETVASTMNQNQVRLLIHGHTHRPDIHTFQLDDQAAKRIVLADWRDHGFVLHYKPDHSFETATLKND